MSARQQLNSYIGHLEHRLRLGVLSRGAAIVACSALATTLLLVVVISAWALADQALIGARLVLFGVLVAAALIGLGFPFWRISRRLAAGSAEERFPEFQQRLVTFVENQDRGDDPFIDLLAADALQIASEATPASLAPNGRLLALAAVGVASLATLVWMVVAQPGFIGYGARQLWLGAPAGPAPLSLRVLPGDATVRRHTDQLVTAELTGILSPRVLLYARYQSSSKWEQVAMQPRSGASGYQFMLTGLPENVEYYVEAGQRRSPHFTLRVADLPAVQHIKVTYHFPSWTGLPDAVENPGGDLRALEGTRADLEVVTDRPLKDGLLVLDNGQHIQLASAEANRYQGTVALDQDGAYHVAALDQGQPVRLSEDFLIEARKANPPTVSIARPGGDYRASPIEEVTVAVRAQDDFGLKDVDLHYSVNGGPERTVRLLQHPGEKQAAATDVLPLEEFKLVPGDLVSVYATAKNERFDSHTDMTFIQVDPFEREFSQSQQAGGGGGGAGGGQGIDPGEISRREKEMIAATFKQLNDKKSTEKQAAETATFLSDAQATLRNQSLSLAGRLEARELTRENGEFNAFQQEMTAAAEAMSPAATRLVDRKWQDAIPEEQQALQHLLRAEATFRKIEVAFGARGGGGGGGGAGRDLASLFDLELDTEKNQYETQQTASSADQRAQEINDALQKLDELARRQESLAQQSNNSAQTFDQRWQQEMLQREAEELKRQVEQLAQGQSPQGQGSQGQGSQGQSSQGQGSNPSASGASGSSGTSQGRGADRGRSDSSSTDARARAVQQAAQQALDRLRQAQDDMRRAASDPRAAGDARLAAERLREASSLLGGVQSQEATGRLQAIGRDADRLTAEEKAELDRLNKIKAQGSQALVRDVQRLADDRQHLADDLATLEQNMRNAARELDGSQRATADRLRGALDGVDQSDLETRLQRTADWLRSGIDPSANGNEAQIGAGLQRLSDQVHQAQQALTAGDLPQGSDNPQEVLNGIERLRRQIEGMTGANQGAAPGSTQPGQAANGQPGPNGQNTQPGNQGPGGQGYQAGGLNRNGQGNASGQPGAAGPGQGGPIQGNQQNGGGLGYQLGFDTGSNARSGGARNAPIPTPQGDSEPMIQQGITELNRLRGQAQQDPEMERQIQALINEMEHLDLRRFPGNPAMVEELHQRLLSGLDTLELQVRQNLDAKGVNQVRGGDPAAVPAGYKDAVAEYFRRLSNGPSSPER